MAKRMKSLMTDYKKRICELDARSIAFYRRNPCIAAEELLGVKLFDAQKYILQSSWNAGHSAWACSRNFGKSFLIVVMAILKAVLFENQGIYIISNKGDQAKETFSKLEDLVMRIGAVATSNRGLKDIVEKETVKSATNKTGFKHDPAGYYVEFYNGSYIQTLNSSPDNVRGKRATLVFFDEAAFCSEELIVICEAFATQNTSFVTDVDDDYNPETEPMKCPTQLVYASSQDEMSTLFYKHYKDFTKKMFAGDRNYFACDMTCECAIKTFMNGKEYLPLLERAKVEAALKANKEKSLREYYNKPTRDGGSSQIIKWGTIRRNERFYLPVLANQNKGEKYIIAFDPARTLDNSFLGVMQIYDDKDLGICGRIVNGINFIDQANSKKYKLDSTRQIERIREQLLFYNGKNPDYEFIDMFEIDAGAGGGGVSTYADALLHDYEGFDGRKHRGLIDLNSDIYKEYESMFPNASEKISVIQPRKCRTQMVEEFMELMDLGVIQFPYEYGGGDIQMVEVLPNGEEHIKTYSPTPEEQLALMQIDAMKQEITSIQRTVNPEHTTVQYALSKEKENKMHDDRFYVAILLAHRLYELRRGKKINKEEKENEYIQTLQNANVMCVSPL